MPKMLSIGCFSAAMLSLSVQASLQLDTPAPSLSPIQVSQDIIPGEYIVLFHPQTAKAHVDAVQARALKVLGPQVHGLKRFARINGLAGRFSKAQLQELRNDPSVKRIEPNRRVGLPVVQSATGSAAGSWGQDRLDQPSLPLDGVYAPFSNGAGVHAYVVDTGIRTTHTDFGGRAIWDFTASDITDGNTDNNGHGTHLAGTVGSNSYGVASGVTLHSVKVLDGSGQGTLAGLIEGIEFITNNHAAPAVAVLGFNVSYSQALNDAVAASTAAGVSWSVPGGDYSRNACGYSPGSQGTAITVAASSSSDAASGSANYGSCVDVFAPGLYIKSLWHTNDYVNNTTSHSPVAAAHVAGAAALIRGNDASCTPAQVKSKIIAGSRDGVLSNMPSGTANRLLAVSTGMDNGPACGSAAALEHVIQTEAGSPVDISFVANGTALSSSNGTFVDNGQNSYWTYTPNPGFSGVDNVSYQEGSQWHTLRIEVGLTGNGEQTQMGGELAFQPEPNIAALPDGGSVAVWSEKNNVDPTQLVYLQRFDASGAKVGGKVQVAPGSQDQLFPRVAVNSKGFVVVTYEQGGDVYAQRLDSQMNRYGGYFYVDYAAGVQDTPDVAVLNDDSFVISYNDQQTGKAKFNLYNYYGGSIVKGVGVFPGISDLQSDNAIIALQDGGFLVAGMIHDPSETIARRQTVTQRFNRLGQPVGDYKQVNYMDYHGATTDRQVSLMALNDNRYVVGWDSEAPTKGFVTSVVGRIFELDGSPMGPEFVLNEPVQLHVGNDINHRSVSFAKAGNSGFMAVWNRRDQGASNKVVARQFDAEGNAIGSEVIVPLDTSAPNDRPDITTLTDGRLGVSYAINGSAVISWLTPGTANGDVLKAGSGNNVLMGNGGNDEVYYSGAQSDYTITSNANGSMTVQDNRPDSPDGTDVLWNVEIVIPKQ